MEYLATLGVIIIAFNIVFLLAVIKKNNSIVDPFWGMSFMIVALYSYFVFATDLWQQQLITALVLIWGIRLSVRLLRRNWGKPEDFRYAKWREEWNPQWFFVRSYLQVFMLQALLCFIVVIPVVFTNIDNVAEVSNAALIWFGVAVWALGFFFESVGDYQLDQFIKNKPKKGAVMDAGLWRYTRHPNYFGEATQWWGIWLIAFGATFGAWWTAISPLLITFLLLKISGVPLLEEKMMKNPNFRTYATKTNKFIPGPPRS